MSQQCCDSGITTLGPLPWGTHFCQFYKTQDDLVSTLVPYFTAGLRDNEACLWVTSEPLRAAQARAVMSRTLPDFDRYLESGQIEILDFEDWYVALGDVDADQVLAGWIDRQQRALDRGFSGLRLTGNTFWLESSGWSDFMEYERKVNETFWKFRILGLCTYSLDRCRGEEVIDVVRNHQFALALRRGEWEVVESSALKTAKGELERLNSELEERVAVRTEELERMVRGRDDYMAVLAHELRNPLGAISNAVTVLEQARPESAAHQRALEVARRQIHQQTRMVDDLLDVSRMTHATFELQRRHLDLAGLVRQAVEDYRSSIENAGVSLSLEVPEDPIPVQADPARVTQVISNLLENAAKFTPAGGQVVVQLRRDDGMAVLTVCDTGCGIPKELLPRIFDPFTQAEQGLDRKTGGLGLGLALVKGITELHGGTVRVESSGRDQGTAVGVALPLAKAVSAADNAEPVTDAPTRSLRVLIIEDIRDAAETLRDVLELWGYEPEIALTGASGLEAARRFRPDVVLCDLGLPEMDGYQVAARLRREPATADARLIALSGYGSEQDRRLSLEAGFDGHLTKPVDAEVLRRLLADVPSAAA